MALSDLQVYNEYAYSAFTEVLDQQIELFNAASEGTILLQSASNRGDFNESAFFGKVTGGLVRRRDAYGSGQIAQKSLGHKTDISVKVAAGTPEIRLDPGQFKWIQLNPEVAGAAAGQQMAVDTLADMLNVALGATYSALVQETENVFDATGQSPDKATWKNLLGGARKFGDQSSQIAAWVMHSVPMHDLYEANVTNSERLFTYGTVNVIRDPFGKLLIMTDAPRLVSSANPAVYHVLGLVPGAARVEQNGDFFANEETKNGFENIVKTYQAEWSYNLSVKGFAWNKATGGASPTDSSLFSSGNWERFATSHKDLAGVVVEVN